MLTKTIPQLKKGDIVAAHGGTFEVMEDAKLCGELHHIAGVAVADSICRSGIEQGYFSPGLHWTFQGNDLFTVTVLPS